MGQMFKAIYASRQSILIIVVLISTLIGCSFTFRYKVKEISLKEMRSSVITRFQDELVLVNSKFKNVVDILHMAELALNEDKIEGSINTSRVIDSIVNVTGFLYIGIADVDGNTVYGYSLDKEDFANLSSLFEGEPSFLYKQNGDDYDIILAVPFSKFNTMKYVLYVRVTSNELVKFLNKGRLLIDNESHVLSFLLYDMKDVVHINKSTEERALPDFTADVLKKLLKEEDVEKLQNTIEQNPRSIYLFDVEGYPTHYMVVMPTTYSNLNFVMLIPAATVNAEVNSIMGLFTILALGIIFVVAFLLIYYEYVVNMNRKSIYYLAYVDEFTGLPNKASLRLEYEKAIGRLSINQNLYIAKFEIYNRGQIARLYGHDIADKFELEVANYFKNNPIQNVYVSRMNDFFAILIASPDVEHAKKVLYNAFENMCRVSQVELTAIFNCGLVPVSDVAKDESSNSEKIDYLVDCCNMAISMTPPNLREHHISVYDVNLSAEILRRDTIEKDLQPALEAGEFLVYLQPKYDLKTNRLAGAEALIRWNYKKQGILAPYKFIPVFEKNGSIALIDNFVLNEVLQLLRKWSREHLRLVPISVNLSQVQFLNPNLINDFKNRAAQFAEEFKFIDIEITESATIEDFKQVVEVLTELKKLGVKLSMDDFGTGYSSLSNLSLLPFDTVKLDKSFVDKIDPERLSSPNVLLIQDVISIIAHFKMTSLVEGVETVEQRNILRDLGCQYCQGYYYSKPLPVSEFEEILRKDKIFEDKEKAKSAQNVSASNDVKVNKNDTQDKKESQTEEATEIKDVLQKETSSEPQENNEINEDKNDLNNDQKESDEDSSKKVLKKIEVSDEFTVTKTSVQTRSIVKPRVLELNVDNVEVVDLSNKEDFDLEYLKQEVRQFKIEQNKKQKLVEVSLEEDSATNTDQDANEQDKLHTDDKKGQGD